MPIVTGYIGPIHFADLRLGNRMAVRTDPKTWRVTRMTPEELVCFAFGVVNEAIFLAEFVQPAEYLPFVFPASEFLLAITADARREVGTFYEYRSRATGRARNGQPSFQTAQFIHLEDWNQARDMIAAEFLRRERSGS